MENKKTVGQKVEYVIDTAIVGTSVVAGVASFNLYEKSGMLKGCNIPTTKRIAIEATAATIVGAGTCKLMQLTKTSIKWAGCKIASKFSSKEDSEPQEETEVQE